MVPVSVWLIEGVDQTVLIDTGLGDIDEVSAMQSRYGVDFVASRSPDQDLVSALVDRGVKPADVDLIVLTHLHFDHIGNTGLFPNARFVVQRDEMPQAVSPPGFCMFYYPDSAYKVTQVLDRLEVIDGDTRIDPKVQLVKIGGYTPGSMVVGGPAPWATTGATTISLGLLSSGAIAASAARHRHHVARRCRRRRRCRHR